MFPDHTGDSLYDSENSGIGPSWPKRLATRLPLAAHLAERINAKYDRHGTIFMLHRVLPLGEECYNPEMATSVPRFELFLHWIRERYEVVRLSELAKRTDKREADTKHLCAITFDDGWKDNYVYAFPILRDLEIPATIFLAVGFIGTRRRFWQERLHTCLSKQINLDEEHTLVKHLSLTLPWFPPLGPSCLEYKFLRGLLLQRPSDEAEQFVQHMEEKLAIRSGGQEAAFMNWDEVRAMAKDGIDFGSHTLDHTLLTRDAPSHAREEIGASGEELRGRLGSRDHGFSYPWGSTTDHVTRMVRDAGYDHAVVIAAKKEPGDMGRWLLPRIPISDPVFQAWHNPANAGSLTIFLARERLKHPYRTSIPTRGLPKPSRIRIALVIDTIDSWAAGGTERYLMYLLDALDRQYFEPRLIFLKPSPYLKQKDVPCDLSVITQGEGGSRRLLLWNLVKELKGFRPHIAQTYFRDATYYGTVAAHLAGVPVIVNSERNLGHWQKPIDRFVLRQTTRLVDNWQCNSQAVWQWLHGERAKPADRIDILPNAIDINRFCPPSEQIRMDARQRLGLALGQPVIINVSNMRPVKGIMTMVEAAAQVLQRLPQALFVVVGEGHQRDELLQRIGELHMSDSVRLVGEQDDVVPWLSAADLGLLTSRSEGSSNSALEYMAMGLPAILSDIPANLELVDGVFYRTGDSANLAEKIVSLWANPQERERMSRAYRVKALQHSTELFAQRAQAFYVRLAAGPV